MPCMEFSTFHADRSLTSVNASCLSYSVIVWCAGGLGSGSDPRARRAVRYSFTAIAELVAALPADARASLGLLAQQGPVTIWLIPIGIDWRALETVIGTWCQRRLASPARAPLPGWAGTGGGWQSAAHHR